jgi:enamine deaminase RidA (YjgF/YER057c/UK114 family)
MTTAAMAAGAVAATVVEFDRPAAFAAAGFPLSEAVRVGDTLYVSGLLGTQGRELAPVASVARPGRPWRTSARSSAATASVSAAS